MERTKNTRKIPDAINCSVSRKFTQIPNELLRNPDISGKAKALLGILLSNAQGWTSYIATLKNFMKEGEDAIRSGLAELEEQGYLVRLRYRHKETKKFIGSFWAYTDFPGDFYLDDHIKWLESMNYEIIQKNEESENPDRENPDVAKPDVEKAGLKIPNYKNTNKDKKNNKKMTFDEFKEYFPQEWFKDDSFQENIEDYFTHRKEKGNTPTKTATKRLVNQLSKFDLPTINEALSRSVANGWTGVFPDAIKNKPQTTPNNPPANGNGIKPIVEQYTKKEKTKKQIVDCYKSAKQRIANPNSSEQLAQNMINLLNQISQIQQSKGIVYPNRLRNVLTPVSALQDYVEWLNEECDWMDHFTPKLFDAEHNIFNKFRSAMCAREGGTDIITGEKQY